MPKIVQTIWLDETWSRGGVLTDGKDQPPICVGDINQQESIYRMRQVCKYASRGNVQFIV